MNKKLRIIGFVIILIGILYINYKFNNLIVRAYNYVQRLPKILIASLSLMAVIAPFLLKNNKIFSKLTDYIPTNNVLSKLARNNEQEKENTISYYNKKYEPPTKSNQPKKNIQTKKPNNEVKEKNKKNKRNVSEQMKKYVAANQGWKCLDCKNMLDASYEVDHIIPLYKGGDNECANLQALCRNCHGSKTIHDKIEENKI